MSELRTLLWGVQIFPRGLQTRLLLVPEGDVISAVGGCQLCRWEPKTAAVSLTAEEQVTQGEPSNNRSVLGIQVPVRFPAVPPFKYTKPWLREGRKG